MSGKEIDRIFAEKLKNHASKPSAKAWKRIEEQLGKPQKKPTVWWKWATLGVLMAGSATLIGYHLQNNTDQNIEKDKKQETLIIKKKPQNTIIEKNTISEVTKTKKEELKSEENDLVSLSENNKTKTTKIINEKTSKPSVIRTEKPVNVTTSKTIDFDQPIMPDRNEADVKITSFDSDKLDLAKSGLAKPGLAKPGLKKEEDDDLLIKKDEGEKKAVDVLLKKSEPGKEINPLPSPIEMSKAKKRKRVKVEITIPPRKKKRGGSQQNQGLAINFKSVLHNVFDN